MVDKDMEENEPVVSMDYVSTRDDNILIILTLPRMTGIKNTTDTVQAIQSTNAEL